MSGPHSCVFDTTKPDGSLVGRVSEDVLLPGGREVRASLDRPSTATDRGVVACPPHPEHGGHRGDSRLAAVSDALTDQRIACLRFDYGPWTGGEHELQDAAQAVAWMEDEYDAVGLFGYSFGAAIALVTAASDSVVAVSVLAPPARVGDITTVAESLGAIQCPIQVVYGNRDTTVEWEPVVERARTMDGEVVELASDHFFIGQLTAIAEPVTEFFTRSFDQTNDTAQPE